MKKKTRLLHILLLVAVMMAMMPFNVSAASKNPGKPKITSVTVSENTVTVNIKKVKKAKSYRLYSVTYTPKWKYSKTVKASGKNKYSDASKYKLVKKGKKYKVYKLTSKPKYTQLVKTKGTTLSFTGQWGTSYTLAVRAYNGKKGGSYSAVKTVQIGNLPEPAPVPAQTDPAPAEPKKSSYETYVFFGSDSRANDESWKSHDGGKITADTSGTQGTPRSDVIMLINVDRNKKRIDLVSIYRDTALNESADGLNFQKANKAYADFGPKEACKVLERNLDIKIKGYAASNFKGVADVIDDLGGVTVEGLNEELVYFKNEDHTGEMTFKDVFGVDDFTQLAPGPHDLKDIAEIPAGCESTGVAAHYECNLCGMWFSDEAGTQATNSEQCVINALGHNYGAWTYLNEDQHQRICSRVTSHVETEYHTWDGGVVTKEPTETEEGVRTYTCTACNATYTESIAKIDPSGSDPGGNGGNSGTENDPTPGQSSGSNPAPGQSSGGNPEQMGNDGTAVGLGASAAAAEKAITNMVSDDDPQGTVFGKLALKSPKQKKTSIDLRWNTVPNASLYVIYGNKCGKGIKPVKLAAVNGNRQTVSTVANQKVAKGTYYKFIVVALDKNNNVVSSSRVIHVATKGGKVGNHKKVTVSKSVIRKAKKLKVGKSLKLKAKAVPQSKKLKVKKHVAIRYESTDVNIATVSKKGVVKAKNKGTCYVYAYAQNGVFKAIKVVVK